MLQRAAQAAAWRSMQKKKKGQRRNRAKRAPRMCQTTRCLRRSFPLRICFWPLRQRLVRRQVPSTYFMAAVRGGERGRMQRQRRRREEKREKGRRDGKKAVHADAAPLPLFPSFSPYGPPLCLAFVTGRVSGRCALAARRVRRGRRAPWRMAAQRGSREIMMSLFLTDGQNLVMQSV